MGLRVGTGGGKAHRQRHHQQQYLLKELWETNSLFYRLRNFKRTHVGPHGDDLDSLKVGGKLGDDTHLCVETGLTYPPPPKAGEREGGGGAQKLGAHLPFRNRWVGVGVGGGGRALFWGWVFLAFCYDGEEREGGDRKWRARFVTDEEEKKRERKMRKRLRKDALQKRTFIFFFFFLNARNSRVCVRPRCRKFLPLPISSDEDPLRRVLELRSAKVGRKPGGEEVAEEGPGQARPRGAEHQRCKQPRKCGENVLGRGRQGGREDAVI